MSRHRRTYPRIDRVLGVYYALRMDWNSGSMGSHDGTVHAMRGGQCPSTIAFMCDVGAAMECALGRHDVDEVLPRRWHAFFMAQLAKGRQCKFHSLAARSSRKTNEHKLARQAETIARWECEAWDLECYRLTKRKTYRIAMQKLGDELEARNLFAQALIGEWAGVVKPPEWG